MGLIFNAEGYYIPFKLLMTAKEKDDVKHAVYVCSKCNKPELSKFCNSCKTETTAVKFYPNGEKETVGSRDLWDLARIPLNQVSWHSISTWKWIEEAEVRKPKASEMAKFNELKSKIGKSPTLEDLFKDLTTTRTAFKGKIVLNSKVNEVYFMPYNVNGNYTIIAGITDGNLETVLPKTKFSFEEIKAEAING